VERFLLAEKKIWLFSFDPGIIINQKSRKAATQQQIKTS
jgi:hypothetical protein